MTDPKELYPLHFACRDGNIDQIKKLIAAGADVNKRFREYHNWTPLHFACITGNTKAVEILIAAGADVNNQDENGWTPLNFASKSGDAEIIKILRMVGDKENSAKWGGSYGDLHISFYNNLPKRSDTFDERGLMYGAVVSPEEMKIASDTFYEKAMVYAVVSPEETKK